MLNICLINNCYITALIIIIFLFGCISITEGGTCWLKKMDGGKCNNIFTKNVQKEECCAAGAELGWSENDVSDAELFFMAALNSGIACSSCVDNCVTAKCGPNKRCVIRQGQPKCICAPNCKQKHVKSPKLNSVKVIGVHDNFKSVKKKSLMSGDHFSNQNETPKSDKVDSSSNSSSSSSNNALDRSKNIRHRQKKLLQSSYHRGNARHKQPEIVYSDAETVLKMTEHKIRVNTFLLDENDQSTKATAAMSKNDVQIKNKKSPQRFASPVCGTDGRTYKNECQLKKRACRKETPSLSVAYKGYCQTTCKFVECPIGQHCLEDQNGHPHCVYCIRHCPIDGNSSKIVCGADGNTYSNLCELKQRSCLTGHAIPLAYKGPCQENASCDNIKCKDRQVCLTDLKTYKPRCVSCSFKCQRRRRPPGENSTNTKICGYNNRTYNSWCQMVKDSCNTGFYIDARHSGVCL